VYQKTEKKLTNTHPFSEATRIDVINYPTSYYDEENPNSMILNLPSARAGRIFPKMIDTTVTLNQTQIKEVFSILYDYKIVIDDGYGPADCYVPHHTIIFYDQQEIIGYFEICLTCSDFRTSKNFKVPYFCGKQWCLMRFFFESLGMNTIYQGEDEYDCGRTPADF
jgi:hypothetical protein